MLINDEIQNGFDIKSNIKILEEEEILLDENVSEDDSYKYIQKVGDVIIRRNNNNLELTPDGLPTIELQLKKIEEADKELIEKLNISIENDNFIKLRCVILHKMDLNILTDTRFLKKNVKDLYINKRIEYIENLTQSELDKDFNNICCNTILDCGEDVSKYPIFL
jgi:hypothetical protein